MKYELKYDRNNRIRVRCGMGAFSFEKARGIEALLLDDEHILNATAADANGSITLEYESGARDRVIETLDNVLFSLDLTVDSVVAFHYCFA